MMASLGAFRILHTLRLVTRLWKSPARSNGEHQRAHVAHLRLALVEVPGLYVHLLAQLAIYIEAGRAVVTLDGDVRLLTLARAV